MHHLILKRAAKKSCLTTKVVGVFEKNIRVYYEDTDAGGIVYHSNYLNFMERCRCDWLMSLGYNVAELEENQGLVCVVREAALIFERPARLFDELRVTAEVLQVGKVKLVLEQAVYTERQLLCRATIKLAALDSTSYKLRAMPSMLRQAMQAG